jgi:hypothetical protein
VGYNDVQSTDIQPALRANMLLHDVSLLHTLQYDEKGDEIFILNAG